MILNTQKEKEMIRKLYRRNPETNQLFYDEAWTDNDQIVRHFGQVGYRGETVVHSLVPTLSPEANLDVVLLPSINDGYSEIPVEDLVSLTIEYRPHKLSKEDLTKRHALEERMNHTLGWLGLGFCDGGSIGSGSVEIFCLVVDFDLARRSIVNDLSGTLFGDYSRIFSDADGVCVKNRESLSSFQAICRSEVHPEIRKTEDLLVKYRYFDSVTHECVDDAIEGDVENILGVWNSLSQEDGSYLGLECSSGSTLQFMWDDSNCIILDVPQVDLGGSVTRFTTIEEVRILIRRVFSGLQPEQIEGLEFLKWE